SPAFYDLFEFLDCDVFDVTSDAFATFRAALATHKDVVSHFLTEQYDDVFGAYAQLVSSQSYATRRLSLKLLSDILLDRANFAVMTRYIRSTTNLKLIMELLRDRSQAIQFEAFHVFKIFVANPRKDPGIVRILTKNKTKLIAFLTQFQPEKESEQFANEKSLLIKEIGGLP
ncbi:Mo25-like protein, partial [Kipferlia bialata]